MFGKVIIVKVKMNEFRRRFREEWFEFNTILFFILLCAIVICLLFIKKTFIIDEIAAFEILNSRGESGIFDLIFGLQYFSVPIFYLWKITIATIFLWMSSFLFGYKLFYSRIWKLVLLMDAIFLIPEILKVIWFMFLDSSQSYEEIVQFYPMSLLGLFDWEQLSSRWYYPLKALNLFEILYWLLLYFGIHTLADKNKVIARYIVLLGYVVPFFLWLAFYLLVYKG